MSGPFKRKLTIPTSSKAIKITLERDAPPFVIARGTAAATVVHTPTNLETMVPAANINQTKYNVAGYTVGAYATAVTTTPSTSTSAAATTSTGPVRLPRSKIKRVALYSGSATKNDEGTAPSPTVPPPNITKVVAASAAEVTTKAAADDNDSDNDELHMQKSDSDEDGYSNIDFFDDNYQLIESDESVDEFDPVWGHALMQPSKVFNFNGKCQESLTDDSIFENPISYFDMVLGPRREFFTKLANSCSTRAAKTIANNSGFHSFTAKKLQIFIGICLQMSSFRLFEIEQYWSETDHFGFDGFGDKMSLEHFRMILDVLNFDMFKKSYSSARNPKSGKLANILSDIKPLLDYFNKNMESVYSCDRRLILGEPLIYWKGKFNWLNEVRDKFRCNAVTLHFLTEPSGMLLKIVPDLEESERKQFTRNSKSLALQRSAIAMDLLKSKLGKGHFVYASKYYSSYALASALAKRQTYCTGFLDCNRYGNSKELILTRLDKGSAVARYAGDVLMAKYRHRENSFYFYSTNCADIFANGEKSEESSLVDVVRELETLLCPPLNIRLKMQNCQLLFPCDEMKWDKRLMIYVINLIVLNAYILYMNQMSFRNIQSPMRYEKFREEVIKSLLNTNLKSDHIILILPPIDGKVAKKRCQICRKGGLTTYSKYSCKMCPGMPGLCETPCFKIWHDQLKKSTTATKLRGATQLT
ncbi:uncharacterized protein LOC118752474 [Rhagoletis pomonella]|uniref:uncharacterized protein LOC118752456 n=1 Tax=Rhagoletis pomonella TaxID=28610 RepID=UPI001786A789|nr:uncharacterized protein LOC118752456 [Rhagoletis pomonella]XP_036343276.1 uncharacterized protein LOC118752474 [Rhagoletis pomonella]